MPASGFTPISLYYSSTGAAVPSAGNLVAGELALNTNDGKLYYKNSSGVVTLLAGATSGPAGGSTTQVQYNNAGVLAGITGATTNGTALTLTAPVLGTPASGTVTNLTGTASININGTVGATTPAAGAFTTVSATGAITNTLATGVFLVNSSGGTNAVQAQIKNTGGDLRLGIESSTGSVMQIGTSAYAAVFGNQGNYPAQITSNGTLVASFSSTGLAVTGTVTATNSAAATVVYMQNTNATTAYGMQIYYSGRNPNNTAEEFIYCGDASLRFSVRSNGGIANYSGNNVNLSDRIEKTNFAPAPSYLDKICAIPVQTFNYIDQNLEEDNGLTLGVVAQDVQAVAPELVMESNWAKKDDEPKMRLSIYQTDLQYALMKCIQEQQAIITALTTRITALEAK